MTLRYKGLLADCEGCGHLVKGGASATCDYVLHTGQPRSCPPGKDCLHYIQKEIWEEENMKKNNGHRIKPAQMPAPIMPPRPQVSPAPTPAAVSLVRTPPSPNVSDSDTSGKASDAVSKSDTISSAPDGVEESVSEQTKKAAIAQEVYQVENTAAEKIIDDFGSKPEGLTVDRLSLLLHRCQMAGLGGNQVSINGKPLPDTDIIAALIRENGIVVELTGVTDRS